MTKVHLRLCTRRKGNTAVQNKVTHKATPLVAADRAAAARQCHCLQNRARLKLEKKKGIAGPGRPVEN